MDAYQHLVKITRPPKKPYVEMVDWPALETEFGLAFPDDHKWFVGTYGWGEFGEWLAVFAPFGFARLGLKKRVLDWCDRFREHRDELQFEAPCPIYPEPGGMLPCASLGDNATVNWVTVGAPNDWWILLRDPGGIDYEEFRRGGLVPFLVEFFSGRLKSRIFMLDCFATPPQKFRPLTPQ